MMLWERPTGPFTPTIRTGSCPFRVASRFFPLANSIVPSNGQCGIVPHFRGAPPQFPTGEYCQDNELYGIMSKCDQFHGVRE